MVHDVERDNPGGPQRPPMPQPKPRSSLVPVVMVLVPLLLFIVGVLAFTGRAGLLILAVIASVPAFVMLHYLLWGYWLGKRLRESDKADHDQSNEPD